jgi:hypothetical protein
MLKEEQARRSLPAAQTTGIASGEEPVRHDDDDDGPTSTTIWARSTKVAVFAPFRGFGQRKREMKYTEGLLLSMYLLLLRFIVLERAEEKEGLSRVCPQEQQGEDLGLAAGL